MNLDNIFIGRELPSLTNVLWIDITDAENISVNAFINGKWQSITSLINDMYIDTIDTNDTVQLVIHLKEGINYIGFYIDITLEDLENALNDYDGTQIAVLNGNGGGDFVTSYNGQWYGNSWTFNQMEGIKIVIDQDATITLTGNIINLNLLYNIIHGYSWINYPLSYEQSANTTFAGFNPVNGDEILDINNKNIKSVYSSTARRGSGGWVGDLLILKPGGCYIYKNTDNAKTVSMNIQTINSGVVKDIIVNDGAMNIIKLGVDNEPIENSRNLITSGAVYAALHNQ